MKTIFENDWLRIERHFMRYYLVYNSGDLTNSIARLRISQDAVASIMKGDQEAYNVIIAYQNKYKKSKLP